MEETLFGGDRTKVEIYMETKLTQTWMNKIRHQLFLRGRNLSVVSAKSNVIYPKTSTHWMYLFMRDSQETASSWILAHERMTGLEITT